MVEAAEAREAVELLHHGAATVETREPGTVADLPASSLCFRAPAGSSPNTV